MLCWLGSHVLQHCVCDPADKKLLSDGMLGMHGFTPPECQHSILPIYMCLWLGKDKSLSIFNQLTLTLTECAKKTLFFSLDIFCGENYTQRQQLRTVRSCERSINFNDLMISDAMELFKVFSYSRNVNSIFQNLSSVYIWKNHKAK